MPVSDEPKTKEYPNFYENLKEANMRLRGTVVLYDGIPHYIYIITGHKPDGIFRVYMEPIGDNMTIHKLNRPPADAYSYDHPSCGPTLDEWLKGNPNSKVIRKHMNSPKFNRFRPFPLGMCNYKGSVYYIERSPTRKAEQGLTPNMMLETRLMLIGGDSPMNVSRGGIGSICEPVRATIVGEYPSIGECIANLNDPDISNDGVAFDRNFALLRGPVRTLFLCYKENVVGFLPNNDTSTVRLSASFAHLKEAVDDLGAFNDITVA